jgi:predicted RNase H-like HicB family nuclease
MRFLAMFEQTAGGFGVQVPDLAIATHGETVDAAKRAAAEAIRVNLEAYEEAGMAVPKPQPISRHLDNPDFEGHLFGYVDVDVPEVEAA